MLRGRSLKWRTLILVAVPLWLAATPGRAQCTSGGSVSQWQCWEQTITSSVNFYNGGAGNPYRDLVLRVTFSGPNGSFTQDAFWVADTANPTSFKVRVALPAPPVPPTATWTWQIAGCTGITGGRDCSSGVTWTPSSGTISVSSSPSVPQKLYALGFPTQNCYWIKTSPPTLVSCPPVVYGDKVTKFFWLGDTAWSAPGVEIDAQLHNGMQHWSQYLATRSPLITDGTSYRFSSILVAPADYYGKSNDPDVFLSQGSACTVPPAQVGSFPNDCSIPAPNYWNRFDNLIAQATQQDLLIVLSGLLHPLDTNPYPNYPSLTNVQHFSRYLAARLAGFAVVFSPGFDVSVSTTAVDGNTLKSIMDASGSAVQAASPNVLITNHLNGQAPCTDYETFAAETPGPAPWMRFYLFQSGHASHMGGTAGQVCPGYLSTDSSAVYAAMRRAITMPPTLAGSTPSLPSINGEGPYDDLTNDSPPNYAQVNMRYHVRQAANLSSLSDAQGFTYGVPQLGTWTNPSSYWGLDSAKFDMQSLGARFRPDPNPGMPTHPEWILNNRSAYDQQMALASNGSTLAIAYVPPINPASPQKSTIIISTSGLPGLVCGSPWALVWESATTNQQPTGATCMSGSGQITATSPACNPNDDTECDWVLLISKSGSASPVLQTSTSSGLPPTPGNLDVWRDLSAGDGTSAIVAHLEGTEPTSRIEVSPSGLAFQEGARVATVPGGYVVVWHADGLDGSLFGVFEQRLDGKGNLVGPTFRVNSTTMYDQRDPVIAADPIGNTVVVWSSYAQDGDLGGIYGQLFDSNGRPLGGEFQINEITAGHQARPQVTYLPGNGFVVAWTTQAIGDDPGALSFRVFDHNGSPQTNEIRIPGNVLLHPELVDLEPGAAAGFTLRWLLRDNSRASAPSYIQQFTTQGAALSLPVALP